MLNLKMNSWNFHPRQTSNASSIWIFSLCGKSQTISTMTKQTYIHNLQNDSTNWEYFLIHKYNNRTDDRRIFKIVIFISIKTLETILKNHLFISAIFENQPCEYVYLVRQKKILKNVLAIRPPWRQWIRRQTNINTGNRASLVAKTLLAVA